jgi:uncharacterized damage-inducible protein DinB
MRGVDVMLAGFDHALKHSWESLHGALLDLTPEEAARRHPAWAHEPHDDGVGKPGTVLWFLNHLEHCHRHYTAVLRARPNTNSPDTKPPGELDFAQVLSALQAANADLRAELAKLKDADLDQPCTTDNRSVAEFLLGVIRHIAWHGGQIATLRRLLRQSPFPAQ